MKIIKLTTDLIFRAREMEAELLPRIKNVPNYMGFSDPDRYYFGFLGELAFEQLLKDNGKKYDYIIKLDGNSQGEDFKLYFAHRPMTVEVKTRKNILASNLLISAKQFDHRTCDLYIGIALSDTIAKIYGYCFKKDFQYSEQGFAKKLPTYYIPFANLHPIEYLLGKML